MKMKLVILTILFVLLAVVLLGVKVLFIKGSRFPSGHIGSNPALLKRGIRCESHRESPHLHSNDKE